MVTHVFTRPPEVPQRPQSIDTLKLQLEAQRETMRTKQPDDAQIEDLPFYPPRKTAVLQPQDYGVAPLPHEDRSANSPYWTVPPPQDVVTTSLAAQDAQSTVTTGAKDTQSTVTGGAKDAQSTVTAGAKDAQGTVTGGAKETRGTGNYGADASKSTGFTADSSSDTGAVTGGAKAAVGPSFGEVVGGVVYDFAKFSEIVPPSRDTSFISKIHFICTRDGRGTTVAFLAFTIVVLICVAVGCIVAANPTASPPDLPRQLVGQSASPLAAPRWDDQWTVPPSAVPWGSGRPSV